MGFNDLVIGDAGLALETVDVLGEELEQQAFFLKQGNEGMCNCWSEFAWVHLLGKRIERLWVSAEVTDVEDSFGIG